MDGAWQRRGPKTVREVTRVARISQFPLPATIHGSFRRRRRRVSCQGCQICNVQWTRQAKIFGLRRPHQAAQLFSSYRVLYARSLIGPPLNRNILSRSQEHDAQCEIMRCCILQNFARSNNAGDYRLGMYIE